MRIDLITNVSDEYNVIIVLIPARLGRNILTIITSFAAFG
jgi:hypothetical protein